MNLERSLEDYKLDLKAKNVRYLLYVAMEHQDIEMQVRLSEEYVSILERKTKTYSRN